MDYKNSICCIDAELDTIWTNGFLYKRNYYPKEQHYKDPPDISHLHQDWWMFDDIPY